MIPRCYFCGARIGPRMAWVTIPRPGGFNVTVATCSSCATKHKDQVEE